MKLKKGKIKTKELISFFQCNRLTFNKHKQKYLDILKDYCDYTPIYSKANSLMSVTVNEIYNNEEYVPSLYTKNHDFIEWIENDEYGLQDGLDNKTALINRYFYYVLNIKDIGKIRKYVTIEKEYDKVNQQTQKKVGVITTKNSYRNKSTQVLKDWWYYHGVAERYLSTEDKKKTHIVRWKDEDKLWLEDIPEEEYRLLKQINRIVTDTSFAWVDLIKHISDGKKKEIINNMAKDVSIVEKDKRIAVRQEVLQILGIDYETTLGSKIVKD